ncbi:MAG: sugar ABC transporter substrate-binding protein [Sphaerochaetaceae bacterium]|mgnify:CR=1 FL=1|jgi:ribose transport system substrate-binding protein|nr:sugar ABC transporter substrate-binding protein [Sphaerochaetaceae bacterium]NLO61374.1 sugar ABC transporter substrate-binding protein [Spirochaetales bacterium]MDD2405124.1 sugar ABC transporter substrate-binding protein [Sphaerochaetaceae bacterium]MDD3671173.1 sugar ABC transporter substrate-binding protein [Sphaerochaetaceae bacterium]MDD4258924.1 sugar ABC transporter substrate-binding protein [Sphaerochaetaceae bacterium]
MKKKALMNIVAVVAILMCALPVFSAGQQEAAGDEIQVTFMVHDLGNPFWATQAKGATDKAKELGVKLTVIDLQVDAAKEISTWENLITAKVDGIMISCVDEEASKAYCQKAQAAGIKVMATVHPLAGADGSLANDEYNYGFLAGEVAGTFIKEKLGGKAKFALLANDATAFVIPRIDGVRDGILSQAPNAVLVARQDAFQTDTGLAVTESLLQAHPDLAVIGCLNDDGALGAYEAMRAAGKDPEKVCITGTDGITQALELIKAGSMLRASVSMAPYESGKAEMDILYKLIKGLPVEPHQKIPNEAITTANVDKYL